MQQMNWKIQITYMIFLIDKLLKKVKQLTDAYELKVHLKMIKYQGNVEIKKDLFHYVQSYGDFILENFGSPGVKQVT